ncbi:MAG: hypothetical protein HC913_19530 [Microscillaceae bacterium]|nr:hypothetical protein [Microscillaceae bacterium]
MPQYLIYLLFWGLILPGLVRAQVDPGETLRQSPLETARLAANHALARQDYRQATRYYTQMDTLIAQIDNAKARLREGIVYLEDLRGFAEKLIRQKQYPAAREILQLIYQKTKVLFSPEKTPTKFINSIGGWASSTN